MSVMWGWELCVKGKLRGLLQWCGEPAIDKHTEALVRTSDQHIRACGGLAESNFMHLNKRGYQNTGTSFGQGARVHRITAATIHFEHPIH